MSAKPKTVMVDVPTQIVGSAYFRETGRLHWGALQRAMDTLSAAGYAVESVSAPRGEIPALLAAAVAARDAMSPVDRALHDAEQQRSWVRGETGRDPGPNPLMEEIQRLRAELDGWRRLPAALELAEGANSDSAIYKARAILWERSTAEADLAAAKAEVERLRGAAAAAEQEVRSALLPCPLCEADAHILGRGAGGFSVVCGYGLCRTTGPLRATEAEAIAAWNCRATPAEVEALRAEVETLKSHLAAVSRDFERALSDQSPSIVRGPTPLPSESGEGKK